MRPNNMVIIPNNKLAQSIVTNYSLPEKQMALLIPVSVSYDSDPDRVEKVLVEEVIEGAKEIPGLLAYPEPLVRLIPGLGESSLDFTLVCHIKGYEDQPLVQHELTKRILKRFRKEGIEIPFPIRTVYLKSEKPED
jgi:small-conductance mechanosensitive channel